jgi:hypothetical protein
VSGLPDPAGLLGGDRLLEGLERWVADGRVDESARARSRERWLRQAAEEDASLAGVLNDLAERRVSVSISMAGGRRHVGTVTAIGADFVALRLGTGGHSLLAVAALAVVRSTPAVGAAVGGQPVRTSLDLARALAGLAAERERAMLVTADGSDAVSGELRSVGRDVVVVRTDGERRSTAYVAISSIAEVTAAALDR